jgi:glycosyltransferase involved in cell wall biosynthesis
MTGTDTSILVEGSPSDTRARLTAYAAELERRRPGSVLTYFVLGAPAGPAWGDGSLQVVPVPGGHLRRSLLLRRRLREMHRAGAIDVVATQSATDEGWIALGSVGRKGVPVVAQLHGDPFSPAHLATGRARRLVRRARMKVMERLLPRYAAIRVVGTELVAHVEARGARRAVVIPVPSMDDATQAEVERGANVLYVGRMTPEKRLDVWVEVAAFVRHRRPDVSFDLVGDGPDRARTEEQVADLGLGDAVRFHGFLPHDRLAPLYSQAGVFLLTSDHEGFGRVLVEAARAGTPVVSTDIPGPRDVVTDGVTGHLRPGNDVEALGEAVLALLDDPAAAATMGNAARADVGRYAAPVLIEKWIDLLVQIATDPR